MLVGYNQQDLNKWRSDMFTYQKQKRTKKPFGKELPEVKIIKSSQIQQKERYFDPIIQQFHNKELQNKVLQKQYQKQNLAISNYAKYIQRHQKNYDIVNNHSYDQKIFDNQSKFHQSSPKPNKNPIRYLFNIINNQNLPQQYYQNRPYSNPNKPDAKKTFKHVPGQSDPNFDYIKGMYRENNQEKIMKQKEAEKQQALNKYHKEKIFDKIYGRYYNPQDQQKYLQQLKKTETNHGKDFMKRFPPSYVHRQPYIQDLSKPLPESVLQFDTHQKNAKKRYQMKYLIEQEYKRRNDEDFQRHQNLIKSKIHQGKILQNLSREHNIINNKFREMNKSFDFKNPYNFDFLKNSQNQKPKTYINNDDARSQRSYRSQNFQQKINDKQRSFRKFIKSGGFS